MSTNVEDPGCTCQPNVRVIELVPDTTDAPNGYVSPPVTTISFEND